MQIRNFAILLFSIFIIPAYAQATPFTPSKNTTATDISRADSTATTPVKDREVQNKDKVKIYHVYDDIDLMAKIDFQYAKPRIIIKLVTPVLSSESSENTNVGAFNEAVQQVVQEEIDKFKQTVASVATTQQQLGKKNISNKLFIDFNTAALDSGKHHIVSIRYSVQAFMTGFPKAQHHYRIMNYDLDNHRNLELTDLFDSEKNYLNVISSYANKALSRRLDNKAMVAEGTAPHEENFKNWNIKPYGLLITFDENQVAPAEYGTQTVLIPYAKLKSVILSNSPLAACLTHRRRCLSSTLLTGGFIDEA